MRQAISKTEKQKRSWFNSNKLGGKIIKEFAALRAKMYSYLTDNNDEDKKSQIHKNVCHNEKT